MKVDYIQHCGNDLSVVNSARVSFDKESGWETVPQQQGERFWFLSDKDKKLVQYLARNGHTSPFNHSFLTVRVKAPIFVARQLVKHKFMPWNEISRRYVDSPPEFYNPSPLRKRAEDKKQGSSSDTVEYSLNPAYQYAYQCYTNMISDGVCPEQARMVLPQSVYTEWYWSGTLGAFLEMLKLRLKCDTQQETRQIAIMIAKIVKQHWPVSYEYLY
jgi:thymidylate synthase (FAD)